MATPTQIRRRGRLGLILGTLVAALLVSAVAYADVVTVNDVVTGGDAAVTRGAAGSAGVSIAASNTDPSAQDASGCNATGSNPATVTLSSNSANVTINSPASKSYSGCGTVQTYGYAVAVNAVLGSLTTISTSTTGGKSGSQYREDSFAVRVLPRPASSLDATANGQTQIDLTWTATPDAADITDYVIYEGATQVATAAKNATSKAITGLAAGSEHCYTIKARVTVSGSDYFSAAAGPACATTASAPSDSTPPLVQANVNPTPNGDGWNNTTPVNLTWSISDPESATLVVSGCAAESFNAETVGENRSCTASSAGGTTGPVNVTIKIDKTKPVISANTGDYVHGTWTNENVTVSFSCADAGSVQSGIKTTTVGGGGSISSESATAAGTDVTNTGGCADYAGNSADAKTVNVKIDKTKPTLDACPTTGNTYLVNSGTHNVALGASDALSGLDSAASTLFGTVNANSVGKKQVTYTALDAAGNQESRTCDYFVTFDFIGFSAPVNNPKWLNKAKAGQAIPLKWRLLDANGVPVTSLSSASLGVGSLSCTGEEYPVDLVEEYAAGSSGLQNLGDGYYQWNWKSPSTYANSCKVLHLNLGEGMTRQVLFQFTK